MYLSLEREGHSFDSFVSGHNYSLAFPRSLSGFLLTIAIVYSIGIPQRTLVDKEWKWEKGSTKACTVGYESSKQ